MTFAKTVTRLLLKFPGDSTSNTLPTTGLSVHRFVSFCSISILLVSLSADRWSMKAVMRARKGLLILMCQHHRAQNEIAVQREGHGVYMLKVVCDRIVLKRKIVVLPSNLSSMLNYRLDHHHSLSSIEFDLICHKPTNMNCISLVCDLNKQLTKYKIAYYNIT